MAPHTPPPRAAIIAMNNLRIRLYNSPTRLLLVPTFGLPDTRTNIVLLRFYKIYDITGFPY